MLSRWHCESAIQLCHENWRFLYPIEQFDRINHIKNLDMLREEGKKWKIPHGSVKSIQEVSSALLDAAGWPHSKCSVKAWATASLCWAQQGLACLLFVLDFLRHIQHAQLCFWPLLWTEHSTGMFHLLSHLQIPNSYHCSGWESPPSSMGRAGWEPM